MNANGRLGRLLRRRELIAIVAMIFFGNLGAGLSRTILSLHAQSLGASLTMIGTMGGVEGLSRLLLALPLGMISDRWGRRAVLSGGLTIAGVTYLLYGLASSPAQLYPLRIMSAVYFTSVIYIGSAYVSDLVDPEDQGLAIGFYATLMGLGFMVGAAVGGRTAEAVSYRAAFGVSIVSTAVAIVALRWGTAKLGRLRKPGAVREEPSGRALLTLIRDPAVLAACLASLLYSAAVDGAMFSFFPLYAATFALGQTAIGGMLSLRSVFSTLVRLPAGALIGRFTSWGLLAAALALTTATLAAMAFVSSPAVLALFMAGEGIAFGVYLTASNTALVEVTAEGRRGAASGLFVMATSFGAALHPMIMGPVADRWGLSTIFWLTAVLLLVGLGAYGALRRRAGRRAGRATRPLALGRPGAGVGRRTTSAPVIASGSDAISPVAGGRLLRPGSQRQVHLDRRAAPAPVIASGSDAISPVVGGRLLRGLAMTNALGA